MKILAIDTTGAVAGVALVDDNITVAEFSVNNEKTHSQTIMPLINKLLSSLDLTIADIDYIAATSGPGSFTGLRIGCATAKGLAHGSKKLIIPVPTLDALAYNLPYSDRLVVPIMDARRNQVYTAIYRFENAKLIRLTDYMAEDIFVLMENVEKYSSKAVFLGDGVFPNKSAILSKGFDLAPLHLNMQRAASIGALALTMLDKAVDYHSFTPFYLRLSQAERLLSTNQTS